MKIRHHLAKGYNEIPLKNLRYLTEHTLKSDEEGHTGWKIAGEYDGENVRQQKHRYEIIFSPEEAREFRDKLDAMLSRFEQSVSALVSPDAEVSDVEGDDEPGDD